ncbi:MAG: DUF4097 family beta strand repeat protein [Chloroflexi bacterium]|nr:DUF4097 family beta strand repeat protein [Chloroflexota bacterium]
MKYKWLIAGSLLLAMLAMCVGIVGIIWFSISRAAISGIRWSGFELSTVSAEADEEQSFTVSGPAILSVNTGVENAAGDITIIGGTGDEIVVKAHKTAWGASQEDAEAGLAEIKVNVTQNGDAVTVEVQRPRPVNFIGIGGQRTDTVDLTITVPATTKVTASTSFGDVSLSGTMGDADVKTSFGDVSVKDVQGGAVEARTDFGEMSLEDVTADGNVEAHSSSGKITLDNVEAEGDVNLSTDFGGIEFKTGNADSLVADTNSGKVELSGLSVAGLVMARSNFGEVKLTKVDAGSYNLDTSSGDINVEGASSSVKAHTDYGDINVTEAEAVTLDLSTDSGAITFAGSLGDGPHTIKTDFGSVKLKLPEETALDFDLSTDFGKIKSDFPITIQGEQEQTHWQGTINGGGERLTAETSSGDISIEILK